MAAVFAESKVTTHIEAGTPEVVIQRFKLYRIRFEKLKTTRLMNRDVLENTLHLQIDGVAQTISLEHQAPDDETTEYFATQLRPFILDRDVTSHTKVSAAAKRHISHPGLNAWCALAGKEYQAILLNPLLSGFPIYLGDDRVLTPKKMFSLFMNAEGPHVFFEHAQQMEGFGKFIAVLKLNFVKLCVGLYMNPIQVLSDTLGIALGELSPDPRGLAGPPAERIEATEKMIRQGRQIHDTKLTEQTGIFPRFRFGSVMPSEP